MNSKSDIYRLTQRLHQKELHLARLQSKQKKRSQSEERLRIRLGNLLNHCPEINLSASELNKLLNSVVESLQNSNDVTHLKARGEKSLLDTNASERLYGAGTKSQFDQLQFGSVAMEFGLDRWEYTLTLGALLLELESQCEPISSANIVSASTAEVL